MVYMSRKPNFEPTGNVARLSGYLCNNLPQTFKTVRARAVIRNTSAQTDFPSSCLLYNHYRPQFPAFIGEQHIIINIFIKCIFFFLHFMQDLFNMLPLDAAAQPKSAYMTNDTQHFIICWCNDFNPIHNLYVQITKYFSVRFLSVLPSTLYVTFGRVSPVRKIQKPRPSVCVHLKFIFWITFM